MGIQFNFQLFVYDLLFHIGTDCDYDYVVVNKYYSSFGEPYQMALVLDVCFVSDDGDYMMWEWYVTPRGDTLCFDS